ncbi:hypothetical protein H2201_005665 [Coniosporium apollinis]|uniref:Uncharacterized protein n=1 Tax=Coniosporium apollinis TaxID=61459 RepID=A0ABQ9NSI4_9PEZI|nr:hypothetical protein H2201_005665 [Coniosporium apollinis]
MADHSKDPPGEDGKIAALKEVVQDGLNINITPSDPIIDSADFEELVRELCHKISPDIRIESTALAALHDFSEALLDGHFEVCLRITPHEDLSFLSDAQFDFVKRIMNMLVLASAAG